MEYIKYYDLNNFGVSRQLNYVLKKLKSEIVINNSIDACMYHNCLKYLNVDSLDEFFDNENLDKRELKKNIERNIAIWSNKIKNHYVDDLKELENCPEIYYDDFLSIITKYKKETLLKEELKESLILEHIDIIYYLNNDNLFNLLYDEIKNYLLKYTYAINLISNKYDYCEDYKLPSFTSAEVDEIINNYLNKGDVHINRLELLYQHSDNGYSITAKTKLLISDRIEKEKELLFKKHGYMLEQNIVWIDENQIEDVKIISSNSKTEISYNGKWIKNNVDFSTLFNNYIYLFGLVNYDMHFSNVSNIHDSLIIERSINKKPFNFYLQNKVFDTIEIRQSLSFKVYYDYLSENNVHLEDMIYWFTNEYLPKEFDVHIMLEKINVNNSFSTKCKTLFPLLESLIKQYNIYVENKSIDLRLLGLTGAMKIEQCQSLNEKKYVYIKNDTELEKMSYYFFHDQQMLNYIPGKKLHALNFYEMIKNNNIKINDFPEYVRDKVQWLLEHNYIKVIDDFIRFDNLNVVYIAYKLWCNKVISYYHEKEGIKNKIDELIQLGYLYDSDGLFSVEESDYLNYFLNNTFSNGKAIRNKYLHGAIVEDNEEDYMVGLRMLILVIIKINDDLCIYDIRKAIS